MNDKPNNDGIDRRNFLRCMAWAGTGLVWTMSGGVPTSRLFAANIHEASARGSFSFARSVTATSASRRPLTRT
jgi:3',5'-cyclic-AMP phosphodiesterase